MASYLSSSDGIVLDISGVKLCSEEMQELCESIQEKQEFKSLRHIYFTNGSLSIKTLSVLCDTITTRLSDIESIVIKGNGLTKEAGILIAKLLISPTHLRHLDLSDNCFADIGIASIAGAFTVDLSPTSIDNNYSNNPSLSMSALTNTLHTLNLSYNSIGDAAVLALCRGLTHLAKHCRKEPALKILNLSGNKLGDKSALCLSQLLITLSTHSNSLNLDELFLNNNPISANGINAILSALSIDSLITSGSIVIPPLKLLSIDQCFPNVSVLEFIGKCCIIQLRLHFTQEDSEEAIRNIYLLDVLTKLHEELTNNSYLTHLNLGYLPSTLLNTIEKMNDHSSSEYKRFCECYELYLTIADQLHFPMTVDEYSNKEIRTSKEKQPSLLGMEELQRQQKDFERLRQQHKSAFTKLADEVANLVEDPLLRTTSWSDEEKDRPPSPPVRNSSLSSSRSDDVTRIHRFIERADHDPSHVSSSISHPGTTSAVLSESTPAVLASTRSSYSAAEGTESSHRLITIDEKSLHLMIRSAVEEALATTGTQRRVAGKSGEPPNSLMPTALMRSISSSYLEKIQLLSNRLDMMEDYLQEKANNDTKAEEDDYRLSSVEERIERLEETIEEIASSMRRERSERTESENLKKPVITVRQGDKDRNIVDVVTSTASRLTELEQAVETEHEFSLKLLDIMLNQQSSGSNMSGDWNKKSNPESGGGVGTGESGGGGTKGGGSRRGITLSSKTGVART